jgi:hypothetical protein
MNLALSTGITPLSRHDRDVKVAGIALDWYWGNVDVS